MHALLQSVNVVVVSFNDFTMFPNLLSKNHASPFLIQWRILSF